MSDQPHYHQAPHTLDPNREIPDDAALSAGNDPAEADAVKAADEEHTEVVQAEEGQEEVGPQDPAGPVEGGSEEDDVPDGTSAEVLDWVGDDPDRAERALQVEKTGQNRSTLTAELEKRS